MKTAVMVYPAHTQSQVSHQESPVRMLEDTTISPGVIRSTNHPCVDVDGISKPERHEIPWTPQPSVNRHWIEIITKGIRNDA
jgi:hypothetical protein